jgi:hypothetical protein
VIFPGKPILAFDDFEISDHNRAPVEIGFQEISNGSRTVSGLYRSYLVTRKHTLRTSWEMLPSRRIFTVDEQWGGKEMRDFYLTQPTFEVSVFADYTADPDVYFPDLRFIGRFSDFSYSVIKRNVSGEMYDFWNVDLTIEEI